MRASHPPVTPAWVPDRDLVTPASPPLFPTMRRFTSIHPRRLLRSLQCTILYTLPMNLPLSPFYFPFYAARYPLSTMASNDPSLPVPHTMESKPPDQVSPSTPPELHSVPPPAPAPPPQPCPPPQTPRGLAPGLHADPGSGLQGQSSPDLHCYSGGDSLGGSLALALGPHVRQLLCHQSMDPDFVRVLRDDFTHNSSHMDAPKILATLSFLSAG